MVSRCSTPYVPPFIDLHFENQLVNHPLSLMNFEAILKDPLMVGVEPPPRDFSVPGTKAEGKDHPLPD